jgi:hypothetical protein
LMLVVPFIVIWSSWFLTISIHLWFWCQFLPTCYFTVTPLLSHCTVNLLLSSLCMHQTSCWLHSTELPSNWLAADSLICYQTALTDWHFIALCYTSVYAHTSALYCLVVSSTLNWEFLLFESVQLLSIGPAFREVSCGLLPLSTLWNSLGGGGGNQCFSLSKRPGFGLKGPRKAKEHLRIVTILTVIWSRHLLNTCQKHYHLSRLAHWSTAWSEVFLCLIVFITHFQEFLYQSNHRHTPNCNNHETHFCVSCISLYLVLLA